jgi:hypothetical protein
MTWEEKLQACQALCDHTLRMRFPGNWYVSASDLNVKEGSMGKIQLRQLKATGMK